MFCLENPKLKKKKSEVIESKRRKWVKIVMDHMYPPSWNK